MTNLPTSSTIEELNLSSTEITQEDLNQVIKSFPNLRKLNLSFCKNISDLTNLPSSSTIEELNLSSTNIVQEDLLNQVIKSFPNLRKLNLCGCLGIKNLTNLPSSDFIEELDLYGTKITQEDLNQVLKSFPNLRKLDLNGCKNIKDLTNLPSSNAIEELDLSYTNITQEGLNQVLESFPNLRKLNLTSCNNIVDLTNLSQHIEVKHSLGIAQDSRESASASRASASASRASASASRASASASRASASASRVSASAPAAAALDSNTGFEEGKRLKAKKIFKPKNIAGLSVDDCGGYRIKIYNHLDEDDNLSTNYGEMTEVAVDKQDKLEEHYDSNYQHEPNVFLGQIEVSNAARLPMPSLTPRDKILNFEIVGAKNAVVKIEFCSATKQHYIEISGIEQGKKCNLLYLLQKGEDRQLVEPQVEEFKIKQIILEDDGSINIDPSLIIKPTLNQLVQYFRSFEEKKLEETAQNKTTLQQIIAQKAGVCRHRAVAFKKVYEYFFGGEVLVCYNDLHAFVEVVAGGNVVKINLGGGRVAGIDVEEWKSLPKKDGAQARVVAAKKHLPEVKILSATSIFEKTAQDKKTQNTLLSLKQEQIEPFLSCAQSRENCFVISDLDEIALWQNVVDENGEIKRAPTALADFLSSQIENKTLVIDWSAAKARHTALNSLLDAVRKINGEEIASTKIISVISREQKIGPDFYSRHQNAEMNVQLNFAGEAEISIAKKDEQAQAAAAAENVIHFYDGDWQSALYGKIIFDDEGNFKYEKGQLSQIIEADADSQSELEITLQNAPFYDREFRLELQKIMQQNKIRVNGKDVVLKQKLRFVQKDEKYPELQAVDIREYLSDINEISIEGRKIFGKNYVEYQILNESTINALFNGYKINEDGKIIRLPIDKTRPFLLTQDLSNQTHGFINAKLAEFDGLKIVRPNSANLIAGDNQIITTNDLDLCRDLEVANEADATVIHINPSTSYSDLIESISYDFASKKFKHQESDFAKKIRNGEKIILVGNASKELSDNLQSLFLAQPYLTINGQRQQVNGQVNLICENKAANNFKFFKKIDKQFSQGDVSMQFAQDKNYVKLQEYIKKLSQEKINIVLNYSQTKAVLSRMRAKPQSNPLKHLLRLRPDYQKLKPILEEKWQELGGVKKDESLKTSGIAARIAKVKKGLEGNLHLFLVGPSGSGKSSIVRSALSDEYKIYEGIENIKFLAEKPQGKPTILLIDEANLSDDPNSFDQFKNLLYNRTLIIDGKICPIPPENKIIFTGNYSHFRGRKNIDFIANNGNIMSWKPLQAKEIKEEVIEPILGQIFADNSSKKEEIAIAITAFHQQFLNANDDKAVTPRDIEMICFRCANLSKQIEDAKLVAALAIYDELSSAMKKADRKDFRQKLEGFFGFEQDFIKTEKAKLKQHLVSSLSEKQSEDDSKKLPIIVKSRENLLRHLDDFLKAVEERAKFSQLATKGKGGFLITGESGGGKSFTTLKYLESQGYVNAKNLQQGEQMPQKSFVFIDASNFQQAAEALHHAFHNGQIAVIDEINSLPLESILNNYLSGVDMDGKKAAKAGFAVIGTQNPPELYANRIVFSPALENRFTKFNLKDYRQEELVELLTKKLTKDGAKDGAEPDVPSADAKATDAASLAKMRVEKYFADKKAGLPVAPHNLFR